jgi:hypothetical protein
MAFSFGFINPPTKIVLSLVVTLGSSFVGESTSLGSIAKLCVMLVVGFLTWPFNTQFPHRIFLPFNGMSLYNRLEDGLLLRVVNICLATMRI